MINKSLDIKVYNQNQASIKDVAGELDISNNKWDFLFDFFLKGETAVYFEGFRLDFPDEEFESNLEYLSENILFVEDNFFRILFKVKLSSIALSRGLISKFWNYYDNSSLIFLKNELEEETLIELSEKREYINEYCKVIKSAYIIYKSFELDVLWIEKSKEMEFQAEIAS